MFETIIKRRWCRIYYLEAYILDLNIENNYKEIKRLELEIQHGKDEKVKYDPIDFLVGIYRDVEEKKVLNIDEYSEFSGFNKKDLKNVAFIML